MLGHHGVRYTRHVATLVQRRLVIGQCAVHAQAIFRSKVALCLAHGQHVGHQPTPHMSRAGAHVRGVVLKHHDALGRTQGQWFAQCHVQHVRRHAGVVLVNKAPVGLHKHTLPHLRLRRRNRGTQQVSGDDLLEQGLRRRCGCWRHH